MTIALRLAVDHGRNLLEKVVLFRMGNGEISALKHAMENVLIDFGGYLKKARDNLFIRKDKLLTQWDHKRMLYAMEQIVSIMSPF